MSDEEESSPLFITLNNNKVTISLLIINIIVFITGAMALSLNAFVLDTLVRRKVEASNLIMCQLAVSDMLSGVLVVHTSIYSLVYFQHVAECVVRLGCSFIFLTSSVYHLALLTLDRFVKIVFPYQYETFITKRTVIIMSVAIWFVSINLGLLPAYGWRDKPAPKEPQCAFLLVLADDFLKLMMSVFFVPLLVITALYCKIFLVVRRHARAIAATSFDRTRGNTKSSRFTQTVVILIGTYVVMFLPISLVITIYILGGFSGKDSLTVGDYIIYTSAVSFLNSVVNPVIYAFKLPEVKNRILRLLRRPEERTETSTHVGAVKLIDIN